MFWVTLLIWAVSTVLLEIVRPKPTFENARPSGLGDFTFPTATEGRVVPIVWGRVKIDGPNVIWYGGLRIDPQTEEMKTGMWSSEDIVVGFKYYVGIQFAICRGPGVKLINVYVEDKSLGVNLTTDGSDEWVSRRSLFGGDDTGAGGIAGRIRWYTGSTTQDVTGTYLAGEQTDGPSYRGTCFAVWEGGYIGNSSNIAPWWFEVERIPDGLNMAVEHPGAESPEVGTCNPMNVLFELLTDTDWGLHVPVSSIDLVNFREAAVTLYDEGNGFGMVLDSPRAVEDLIREVERQIDGTVFFDRVSALWKCKLARADYVEADLPVFDESNIIELTDYTRQTWEETTNQVRVKYVDIGKRYNQSYALAQDMANASIQNARVCADMTFPGVKRPENANKIAWRELRVLAFPLGKINIKANRQAFQLLPGSVFKFSWARLGLAEAVYRVSKINHGDLSSKSISLFAVQDVFSSGSGVFSDPLPSNWVEEHDAAEAAAEADTLVLEAPRQFVAQDPSYPLREPRMYMGARWPGGGTTNFKTYTRIGLARPLTGDYIAEATLNAFLLAGELTSELPAHGTSATRPSTTSISVDNTLDDLASLVINGNSSSVDSLITIVYIDGEYIGFEELESSGAVYLLKRIYRGLCHTAAKTHAAGTRVWFVGQTGGRMSDVLFPDTTWDEVDVQLRSNGPAGELEEGDVPIIDLHVDHSWLFPLPPRDPVFHASYAPASVTLDTSYTTETGLPAEDARAIKFGCTPRDWRIDYLTADHQLGSAYLDDSPTFDVVLTLDPDGSPTVLDAVTASGTETPVVYLLRNAVIVAVGANAAIPSSGRVSTTAEHTVDSITHTNPTALEHDFTLTTALQSGALLHGGLTVNVAGTAVIYNETGTYTFDIFTALPSSGILEANVNGAGYATVVAAAATTGTLALTATDSVVLRFSQAPTNDQFFDVTGPTSETGYGVLKA